MVKFIKGLALITAMTAVFVGQACAVEVAPSPDALRFAIQQQQKGADDLRTKFRDVRCPQQPRELQGACESAYNLLIARLNSARAELEAVLAATLSPEPGRSQILKAIQNPVRFERDRAERGTLGDQVYLLFPVPRQSSEK